MKKSTRPPENWQDFETLCKKLFGEIWGCPHTIKKNGRLGQTQFGVDIYGKPKGTNEYWGIQCKGKDNYVDSKLTEKEIDIEVNKALQFEPKLKVLIFTTTAPKDVNIEQYIRKIDTKSCNNGNFEIVLYSWQDLADLIEENRDTFNWYVNNIQFKEQFDIEVRVKTDHENNILKPKFLKKITNFKVRPKQENNQESILDHFTNQIVTINPIALRALSTNILGPTKINHGWSKIHITINNIGSIVLEDWKLWVSFDEKIDKVNDDFSNLGFMIKDLAKYRTTWVYDKEKEIIYRPLENAPLIQKDCKGFDCFCIPYFESKETILRWHLLARDFDKSGEVKLAIEPEYEIEEGTNFIDNEAEIRTESKIKEYITIKEE